MQKFLITVLLFLTGCSSGQMVKLTDDKEKICVERQEKLPEFYPCSDNLNNMRKCYIRDIAPLIKENIELKRKAQK